MRKLTYCLLLAFFLIGCKDEDCLVNIIVINNDPQIWKVSITNIETGEVEKLNEELCVYNSGNLIYYSGNLIDCHVTRIFVPAAYEYLIEIINNAGIYYFRQIVHFECGTETIVILDSGAAVSGTITVCSTTYWGPSDQAYVQRDELCQQAYILACANTDLAEPAYLQACTGYNDLNYPYGPECPYCP